MDSLMRASIARMKQNETAIAKQLEYALWKYAANLEENTHAEMWLK